jgi:hypothetical protein
VKKLVSSLCFESQLVYRYVKELAIEAAPAAVGLYKSNPVDP